jgi:hypothetical protein
MNTLKFPRKEQIDVVNATFEEAKIALKRIARPHTLV